MDPRPIGVFDSGLGGLTAVRQLMDQLPGEDIIYFGDTARVPYGSRSRETILKYTRQDIAFLLDFDIKAIVIACNTADTAAGEIVQREYALPIQGALQPTAERAAASTRNGKIGVIRLLTLCGLCPSNGEARRLIQQGGVTVNEEKVTDPNTVYDADALSGDGLIIRRGKKNFMRLVLR